MKGDFSRFTHKPEKHYTSVLKQQGRVDLDADWNEQACIQAYLNEEGSKDIMGPTGVPSRLAGFGISGFRFIDGDPENGVDFIIGPGRIYVDGILCELEDGNTVVEEVLVSYLNQPNYLQPELISAPTEGGRIDLIYLDVWKRHITTIEDDSLREIALGGPDTTTRAKTIWQVKVLEDVSVANPCGIPKWQEVVSPTLGWGRLSVKLDASEPEEKPCATDSEGGYRGRENRLYRVEIHNGGMMEDVVPATDSQPTFKWSRDNGAVVFPIQELDGLDASRLKIKRLGKDQFLNLHKGDWVEVLDDARELAGKPGIMAEVTGEIDEDKLIVTLSNEVSDIDVTNGHAKLRRWDQMGDAISINPNVPVDLEAGLQVEFSEGRFKTGDYWAFTARSNGEVELLDRVPPMGIEHHYCTLALITWKSGSSGIMEADVLDCRRTFPSLTDFTCLYYVGGDGQEAMPGKVLKQPLQVGVSNGSRPINGPHVAGMNVEFSIIIIEGNVSNGKLSDSNLFSSESDSISIIVPVGEDGIAKCYWELGNEPNSQQVEARLIDACEESVHLPIRFSANLSVASEVAYDAPRCTHMYGVKNVRVALNALCENYGLYYVSGDGQEGLPESTLPEPLRVKVTNGKWPLPGTKVKFEITNGRLIKADGTTELYLILTTDDYGIAECSLELGTSGNCQITAKWPHDAHDAPAPMTIHFNASVLTADRVCYEFPVDCRLEGVDNVKRALDALCKMPRGCLATVGKGGRYESLSSALDALLNRGSGICICLLPGDHDVKDLLPNGGGTCSLHISGCGPGTRLLLTGGLKFSAFLSLHLIDMNILGQDDESRMDIEGSSEVVIRGCKISNSVTGSIPITINDAQKILVEKNIINSYDIGRMPTYFKIFENFSKPIADLFFKPDRSNLGYNARSVAKALASSSKDNRLKLANGLDELMGLSKQEAKARYMFQEVMKKESVSSASIEAKLKDIFDTAAQINPVDAIIIGANSGDVTIADNEIFGNLRFYGKKVEPKEILDGIFNLLKERDIQFDDNVSMLQMRGNRLTGSMGIGEDVHAMLKGESLDGIFSQMIITDNVMESASMHILARDVRMTSNKLMTSSGQTYEALDETAIFLGNSAEEDMELKFVCRSKKKDLCICEHNLKIDFHCSYWE